MVSIITFHFLHILTSKPVISDGRDSIKKLLNVVFPGGKAKLKYEKRLKRMPVMKQRNNELFPSSLSFFLYCNYRCAREIFFEKINLIDANILQQNDLSITKDLLSRSKKLKNDKINALSTSTIEFI